MALKAVGKSMKTDITQPTNQQWKHQNNVWNLPKITNKDTRTTPPVPYEICQKTRRFLTFSEGMEDVVLMPLLLI